MDRKGQFDVARKSIYWGIAGVVMTMIVLGFALMIAGYQNKLTFTLPELKAELISLRFVNNPDCFAYQETITGKVITNSVDLSKFNTDNLNKCYVVTAEKAYKDYNFRLALINTIISSPTGMIAVPEIYTINYYYVDSLTLKKPVLVYDAKGVHEDQLQIHVEVKV